MRGASALERVMAKTAWDGACWIFTGCTVRGGYGQVRVAGRTVYVHRVAYEGLVGPIPDGYQVDHLCHRPACVNPGHLEAVPPEVNQARTRAGGRGSNVAAIETAKTHCPRNHPYDDENTYRNARGYRWCRACRRERYAEKRTA